MEAENPNPIIFSKACKFLGVETEDAVHVGDDSRNDICGARDEGCDAWLWGTDVHSFKEVSLQSFFHIVVSLWFLRREALYSPVCGRSCNVMFLM